MQRSSFGMPKSPRGGKVFRNSKFTGTSNKRQGAFINPDKFVNKAVEIADAVVYAPTHQFIDWPFVQGLAANIASHGYVTPTPIQDQAITAVLEGNDLIGLANTGTGKTAAF